MSEKLTITIEPDDAGVGVRMTGSIGKRTLLQGAAMIINQVCEIVDISRVQLFECAVIEAQNKPDVQHGTCVKVPGSSEGGTPDENL